MEGVMQGLRSLVAEPKIDSSKSSSLANSPNFSSDQARILVRRTDSHLVSVRTCTKLCAISLLVGVVVGYTLKRRVKRWASKLLKRLKDD
ncbi:hypothetical protein Sjap_011962 [Stephania japonica]|uniref:Transmembrane protein n=1 Tax=Stephania japonica TaxID=461633 RepID=A0AAP0JEE1_9MAGN